MPAAAVVPEPLGLLALAVPKSNFPRRIAHAAIKHVLVPRRASLSALVGPRRIAQRQGFAECRHLPEVHASPMAAAVVRTNHTLASVPFEPWEASTSAGPTVADTFVAALGQGMCGGVPARHVCPSASAGTRPEAAVCGLDHRHVGVGTPALVAIARGRAHHAGAVPVAVVVLEAVRPKRVRQHATKNDERSE
eukprot:CAMPEP_0182573314 /NCGR_PEP_ID=MMETSP1324-20130603/19403_1 /TAXON_ID=236786 /ORGANISM="Florenciella sp., Strain RCC1587" /LENGTH=192 /DNA_ID=CAMNT_0024788401 /DNA_START=233 /DNA_END=811 /DNA_ORIENTATION=-